MKRILEIIAYIILFLVLFFPMGLSIFYSFMFENLFSDNTGLYFYSALLQANAAILSIVGVFYIFRIQSNQNSIDILKNLLLSDKGRFTWPESIIEFESLSIKKRKIETEERKYPKQILPQLTKWTNLEEQIITIKASIAFPTCLLSLGIIVYAAGILSANKVHKLVDNLEFQILYGSFLFELFTIHIVVKAILRAIK